MRAGIRFRQEVTIGFVEDQPDAACLAKRENLVEKLRRIDRAAGIIRRDDGDRPCVCANSRLDIGNFGQHAVRGMAVDIADADAKHAKRRLMVEIAGTRHQDFIAMPGHRENGCDEGLIASRSDENLFRHKAGVVEGAEMGRIGIAKLEVTLDPTVAGAFWVCCRTLQRRCHLWMRRITGDGLAHINQLAEPAIIGGAPVLDDGYRRCCEL